jgi:hypothetical protein
MTERAWGRQIIGGLLCLGFGGAVSLIYSFSQGNAVNLDTDLGNYGSALAAFREGIHATTTHQIEHLLACGALRRRHQ